MSDQPTTAPNIADELAHYGTMLDLNDFLPLNVGLNAVSQETMISILGSPLMPLTTDDHPSKASPLVTKLKKTVKVSEHVVVTAIQPAIDSLSRALNAAFEQEKQKGHNLESVLGTDGMLVVRLRRPTSGIPSTKISNHAWGTAIDFKLVGHSSPGNTGHQVPRFVAVLLAALHAEGWFSGISFHDTMHFEVADQTIRKWSADGKFK